jgi:hypothetical protein
LPCSQWSRNVNITGFAGGEPGARGRCGIVNELFDKIFDKIVVPIAKRFSIQGLLGLVFLVAIIIAVMALSGIKAPTIEDYVKYAIIAAIPAVAMFAVGLVEAFNHLGASAIISVMFMIAGAALILGVAPMFKHDNEVRSIIVNFGSGLLGVFLGSIGQILGNRRPGGAS